MTDRDSPEPVDSMPRPLVDWRAFEWSEGGAFCHTALELLATSDYPALEVLQPGLMVLHTDQDVFVLLEYSPEREPRILKLTAELVRKADGPRLSLALIGGDETRQELLQRVQPTKNSLRILHLPEPKPGAIGSPNIVLGRGRSKLHAALTAAAARRGDPIPPDRAREAVASAARRYVEQARERQAFSRLLSVRRPLATYAILACIGATFLLQLQTGATSSTEALLRMGALSRPLVAAGEWWRMPASGLLHGGVMHVAFNGYVLYALGGLIERLLGTSRFVVLYVLSGLAAACGSLALSGGLSVGASGAIWGMLGALGALAFGPSQLLPPSVRRSIQRATLINLAINTAVSLLPFIDWAAHFAGGVAGAVLVFSRLCLPRAGGSPAGTGWTITAAGLAVAFFGTGLAGVLGLLA